MMKSPIGFVTILLLLTACTVQQRSVTYIEATIPVAEERISLSPIISEIQVEQLPGWPSDPYQQQILLKNLNEIWTSQLAEFRRCQKRGLYTMVDDNDNPSMRISITLTALTYTDDTLSIPVRLLAERLRDDQRYVYTLPARAVLASPDRKTRPFHYYARLLSEYRQRFPYAEIVSFFYRHAVPD